MSSAPTGSCAPSFSRIDAAIRRASGTPRRWMPTRTSPAVPACFSTISWEMRTTALRISSEVMIRRPFTTLPPGLTGPHRRLAGRARRSWPSVASTLAQDQDVRRGLRLDLAERVATPAEHLERALLAVLAGRADPGQPVLADREAPQRRLARQRLVLADRAGRRVDDHEVQASVGRLGVLAHPDREADAVGIEL